MSDKKAGKAEAEAGRHREKVRAHGEGLGHVWAALTGGDPVRLVPQILATVLQEGGTRAAWQWRRSGKEFIMMAWPPDQPLRAGVLMSGPEGGKLVPQTVVPILEGFANDLEVEEVHLRQEGLGGDVAVNMLEGKNPMWFFDPFFDRDKADLTPGVTHTFWIGAVALGIRKALLDEIAITQGPQYEEYAIKWLGVHEGASRMDVPPLKVDMRGKAVILPGRFFGEYQIRAQVEKTEDLMLDKMPVKALYLSFPFEDRPPLRLPLYASQSVLCDFAPEPGQEIEAHAWFQGRVIDLDQGEQAG